MYRYIPLSFKNLVCHKFHFIFESYKNVNKLVILNLKTLVDEILNLKNKLHSEFLLQTVAEYVLLFGLKMYF